MQHLPGLLRPRPGREHTAACAPSPCCPRPAKSPTTDKDDLFCRGGANPSSIAKSEKRPGGRSDRPCLPQGVLRRRGRGARARMGHARTRGNMGGRGGRARQSRRNERDFMAGSPSAPRSQTQLLRALFLKSPINLAKTSPEPGLIYRERSTVYPRIPSVHAYLGWSGHDNVLRLSRQDMEPKE